jgi:hypothetical protein
VTDKEIPPPEITDELREQARRSPGGWVYALDPEVDPDGRVPGWAVRGGFRVDDRGELTGEYRANPKYRPSPKALGLPAPANALEDALQRAATHTGPQDALLDAIVESELILFAREPGSSELYVTRTEAGETVLQAFTSDAALPSGWSSWQRATGRDLAGVLAGKRLQLNPGSAVTATIPGDDVAARVRG